MNIPRQIPYTLKLDEGFLRRQCPNCRRVFKWQHTEKGQSPYPARGNYHCPYCGQQAEGWSTEAQQRYIRAVGTEAVSKPVIDSLEQMAKQVNRSGGGFVKVNVTRPRTSKPQPLPRSRINGCVADSRP